MASCAESICRGMGLGSFKVGDGPACYCATNEAVDEAAPATLPNTADPCHVHPKNSIGTALPLHSPPSADLPLPPTHTPAQSHPPCPCFQTMTPYQKRQAELEKRRELLREA